MTRQVHPLLTKIILLLPNPHNPVQYVSLHLFNVEIFTIIVHYLYCQGWQSFKVLVSAWRQDYVNYSMYT